MILTRGGGFKKRSVSSRELDHPNIVSVVARRLEAEPLWYAMPLYDHSLYDEIESKMTSLASMPSTARFSTRWSTPTARGSSTAAERDGRPPDGNQKT